MTKKIETLDQLRTEVRRLEEKKSELQILLKADFAELKNQLRPGNLAIETIADITGITIEPDKFKKNNFTEGIKSLLQQIIDRAGQKIEEKAHDFVERTFDWLDGFMEKVFSRKKGRDPN